MRHIKETTTIDELCDSSNPFIGYKGTGPLHSCFKNYMEYCRKLKFEQKPDYKYLKALFDDTFKENMYELDGRFKWHEHKENVLAEKFH